MFSQQGQEKSNSKKKTFACGEIGGYGLSCVHPRGETPIIITKKKMTARPLKFRFIIGLIAVAVCKVAVGRRDRIFISVVALTLTL